MALSQFNSFTMSARMAILTPYHPALVAVRPAELS
jgi:hypothetical protein